MIVTQNRSNELNNNEWLQFLAPGSRTPALLSHEIAEEKKLVHAAAIVSLASAAIALTATDAVQSSDTIVKIESGTIQGAASAGRRTECP